MLDTVVFQIAGQRYALPVSEVREIVRLPALIALAGAPPAVCGLLNLRGVYIPVLDGRRLLGAPPELSLNSQIVIAGDPAAGGRPVLGLLVDYVTAVQSFASDEVVPIDRRGADPFLRCVLRGADGATLLMDLAELRRRAPALDEAAVAIAQ